jgi:hypothetical protein
VHWIACLAHADCHTLTPLPSLLQFWHYFWPSVIGVLPGIVMFVYLGTLAKNLTELLSQDNSMASTPKTGGHTGLAEAKVLLQGTSACTQPSY